MKIPKTPELWYKACKIIPGGNGLISKRPTRFSPDFWPTYYKKASGINIQAINNKWYKDMSVMGLGTNILGYSNNYVNQMVKKSVDQSPNTTLNCVEEYLLAKELLKIDKFADQVRFARSGGEALAMSVRIARAKTEKDTIAFSGYHGWHDWYLSTNIKNKKNLNEHLLAGLEPLGVPKGLAGSAIPFKYNSITEFKKTVKKNPNLAAIVIEGCRFSYPSKKFVNTINNYCKRKGICLIVDEITSGWRETIGGIYNKVGFKPDIVVYGKGIGNGFAISAIVGKKKFMETANMTFMSSTSWTEKIGFVAALSTIKFFKKKKVHLHIKKIGKKFFKIWLRCAKKNNLDLTISEFAPLASFNINYKNKNEIYTLFTQLMLSKGYIAGNSIYVSYSHKNIDLLDYEKKCNEVFKIIKKFINNEDKIIKVKGRMKTDGFSRLTK